MGFFRGVIKANKVSRTCIVTGLELNLIFLDHLTTNGDRVFINCLELLGTVTG